MPFIRTKLDYAVTFMFLIVFVFAFFFMSSFGDLHYSSNAGVAQEKAFQGNVNMQVYLGPLILVYEMFQIYILPGKKRIRDIDKRLLLIKFNMAVRNKLQEGIDDYRRYRNR